jgi:4-alpha-glucanotransferase
MMRTDRWGIDAGYEDALGGWQVTSEATRLAILTAMGVDATSTRPDREAPFYVMKAGQTMRLDGPADLRLEDGTVLPGTTALPPDLPLGYHALCSPDGEPRGQLIVSPRRCYLPPDWRSWGWAVQLYALRSADSWGFGDLLDLQRLAHWSSTELGAGMLLVNPLTAASPVLPQEPSPYFPSSRRYRNLLYLHIEALPGASQAHIDFEPLAEAGRALNRGRRIDRDSVFRLKMRALERLWFCFGDARSTDRRRP